MKVKLLILNKNIENGIEKAYPLDENFIFTDNYNETLDSVNLRISHLASEIDIEVGDYAWLRSDDLKINKYYMVQNYVITQDTVGIDNASFSYDISLCSQTKDMEGCICPNLSITPLRTGTKRSIYWYLELYNNLYGKKRRVELLGVKSFINQWTFSQETINKFSNITAPEKQWNAPTLREVFNDLMMVVDCIPVIENNIIKYIDLTEKKNLITDFNYIQRSQSIDDYASELKMDMQNVLQTQVDNVRNTMTTTEYLTFDSDDYLITSDNIVLKTTYPILKIKHLWMGFFTPTSTATTPDAKFIMIDLTDFYDVSFVKEYQEYITLNIAYKLTDIFQNPRSYCNYQNYCIYYTRGSNVISGFTNQTKRFIWSTTETIQLLKEMAHDFSDEVVVGRYYNSVNSYFSTFFKIEYETMTDQVFSASKDGAKNKRTVVDNQTNSWVDAYTQGNLEYQKANRIGNQVIMFNQRVTDIDDAIKIGDYYTETKNGKTYDIVIYQVQYQTHEDHIEVNAYGTKDYILRNYWTGINSKIRTWVNAKDEALVRHELEKFYCGLSFTQHNEIVDVANGYDLAKMISGCLIEDDLKSINFSIVKTELGGGYFQPTSNIYNSQWRFELLPDFIDDFNNYFDVTFTSNNTTFTKIKVIVEENGAFARKIIYEDENQTETIAYNGGGGGWLNTDYRTITIISGLDATNDNFLKWLNTTATLISSGNDAYQTETITRIIGNSYVFTTGFNDNYEVSKVVSKDITENDIEPSGWVLASDFEEQPRISSGTIELSQTKSGIPIRPLKYVDDNGEFVKIDISFFNDIDTIANASVLTPQEQKAFLIEMFNRPLINENNVDGRKFTISKQYHKDNKEIFKVSVQFEMFTDDDDIMFTNYLLRNNPIIQDNPQAPNIIIYGSYNKENTLPSDAVEIIATLTRTSISNVVTEFTLTTQAQLPYIYITDANDNVLIRLSITNHQTQSGIKFYLNVLKDRDYTYYNALGKKGGEI